MSSLNSEKLTSYFAGQDAGSAGSNYEDMVDNVRALGHASVDCRACSGKGYNELPEEKLREWLDTIAKAETIEHRDQARRALSHASDCKACKGSGKVSARRGDLARAMDSMFTTVRCGSCRGSGEVTNPTDTSAERQDVCLTCGGEAYIVPVTVRSKGSSNQGGAGGSSATDHDAGPLLLASAAAEAPQHDHDPTDRVAVAAEIEALRARDPQLADALASYHGHEAEPWVQHAWGRGFVLWQHTTAGKLIAHEVAEQSERRAGFLVAPTRLLALARDQVEMPGIAPVMLRDATRLRVLLARADREARELQRRIQAFEREQVAAA